MSANMSKKPSRTNVHIRLMAATSSAIRVKEPTFHADETTTTEDSFTDFATNSFKNSMIVQATQDFNNRNKNGQYANANGAQKILTTGSLTENDPYLQESSRSRMLPFKANNLSQKVSQKGSSQRRTKFQNGRLDGRDAASTGNQILLKTLTSEHLNFGLSLAHGVSTNKLTDLMDNSKVLDS